ncbi:MAG: zinc dependent phospholipase C family protein, partial [Planctomycetales bacterium]|nr:zinc dependent phospholipase C family protein [Planctomycetales bacterium]
MSSRFWRWRRRRDQKRQMEGVEFLEPRLLLFKPQTHVEVAKDVRFDVIEDGKVELVGREYAVHPSVVQALKDYPSFYYAGAVGPDAFPDVIMGQSLIHPVDTGMWFQRIFDSAWSAQTDPAWSPVERSQILAFAYGYATHGAGDFFAHSLVNEFTEGIFPSFAEIVQNDRDLGNAVRHFMLEGYVGDVTPGTDNQDNRTLLPDGDISNTSTHGITYDVPTRFVYETLLKPFPLDPAADADTGYTSLGVSTGVATNAFTRVTGSFINEGFQAGQEVFAFGFGAANNHSYLVLNVTDTTLTVFEPIAADSATGDGDEALVTQGSRGVLLDRFFDIQRAVDTAADAAQLAFGGPPSNTFDNLFNVYLAALADADPATPTARQTEELFLAYLRNWSSEIGRGIQDWGEIGLAIAKGLFDSQTLRDLQNYVGKNVGIDVDPSRGEEEGKIGIADTLVTLLDDPNLDGDFADSFLNRHLLPMFGVPPQIAQLRTALQGFGVAIDDNIVGPLRLALNPITDALDAIKELPKQFIEDMIEERYGIDVDQFDLLSKLNNKVDLASITVGDRTIPIFKPGDHAKIDRYLGIQGIAQSDPLAIPANDIPGVTFYEGATVSISTNVEFDKQKFAAYANSVTLGKLLLLSEDPLDGNALAANQMSQLMTDLTGASYDWSLLNINGAHGGNIFTSTLPKPGQEILVQAEVGPSGTFPVDSRPWLLSIDGSGSWRDGFTTTTFLQYRINPPSPGAPNAKAVWQANVPTNQEFKVQVSWLANVTQRIDDPNVDDNTLEFPFEDDLPITPATNATYRIFDGANPTPIATIQNINQQLFNLDVIDGEITYDEIATVSSTSGVLRIEMDNDANGHVIAGPVRLEPAAGGSPQYVRFERDPNTLSVLPSGYSEQGPNWVDSGFRSGTGNFPLWESKLLRPAFRQLFVDWMNGSLQFPDLGDQPSDDPNQLPIAANPIPSAATPFDPLPTIVPPAGVSIVVTGNQTQNVGDIIIAGIVGDGTGPRDSLTIVSTGTVRITGDVGGEGLSNLTIQAQRIEIDPQVIVSTRSISGSDPLTNASNADSGSLSLSAGTIIIGNGAALLSHANGAFAAGDVTLTATVAEDLTWTFGIGSATFQGTSAIATIDVGDGALIRGRDVAMQTNASTLKSAELTIDIDPADPSGLEAQIDESELVQVSALAAAAISESLSQILVRAGVDII